ncbi:PAS domain S-box protein [Stagnimonas aquatica]|uniref:Sensory/regulatory protein RpfC n=1 Tax=Stagnimonas aquatica TaxID=2689987 RepID=A0A3N0VLW4_9GAMM|nr:transporter substrate-binding domain-containing protein [Stagnimonas aquatica]ROH93749.1 PAS domain S-box protein [Stagnimonas aquatica]
MSSLRAAVAAATLLLSATAALASHQEATVADFRAQLTPEEQAFLQQNPVVRFGADPAWPPFEFLDEQGRHSGLAHDLLNEIAALTGQRYELVRKDSWAATLEAARSAEVDLLTTAVETPDRRAFLRFSAPYMELFEVIITRNDSPYINSLAELRGQTVAVVRGVAASEWLRRHEPQVRQAGVGDIREALTAVAVGRAAATVLPLASANYQIQLLGLSNLQITAPVDGLTNELKFAVRRDWPEQAAILEKALRAIPPEHLLALRARWLTAPQIKVVDRLSPAQRNLVVGTVFLLVLAILWILWLRAEIQKRRRAQSRAEQAERRLRELAAGIPGALWQFRREPDGRQHYGYLSEGIVRITGRTPAETNALMQSQPFAMVHPEDRERLAALIQRLTEDDSLGEERYRLKTADGRWVWVRSAAVAHREPDGSLVWNGITLDATRAAEVKQELMAARQRMKELIDSVPGAVWRLRLSNGRYLVEYVSEGVTAVTGRPVADHLGDAEATLSTVQERDRERLLTNLAQSALDGSMVEQEVRLRATDGRLRHLLVRANVSRNPDGEPVWTGVLQDMTERRRLEAALADARSRLDDIIANFPGTVWQLKRDLAGREFFTYLSEGVTRITGLSSEQVLGQPSSVFDSLLSEADRERSRQALALAVERGRPVSLDYCLNLPGESQPRWVRVTTTGRREADGELIWNGVVLDATEQKTLEQDLRRASAAAEAANQAKSRFLANMSHEIRTPMNAVIGLSHLALSAEQEPAQRERLDKINRAAKALLRLLNDILEFSKLEAQKLKLMPVPFSLRELIDGLQLLAGAPAAEKGLRFSIQQEPGLPRQLVGDALRIQQVLLNLLANATKFTDAGEVRLRIRPAGDGAHDGTAMVAFEVSDTGIGMDEGQLSRVFDAFEQADDSASRRHGGTGLGLTITQELVRLMGGDIQVRSQLRVGTVFTVVLPLGLPEPLDLSRTLGPLEAPEEPLSECVQGLLELLRQHDTAARGKALRLRALLMASGRERELELLERQLSAYDFDSAERELRRLAGRWGLDAG